MRNKNPIGLALWLLLLGALCSVVVTHGADIQRGITFQDGQRLTASQLHTLVDNATILPGFYLNKAGATSLESSDTLLLYSTVSGEFFKISANTLLYNNTDLITTQPEKLAPGSNDYILIYDATASALAKASLGNMFSNNFAGLPTIALSNLTLGASVAILGTASNGIVTLTNLFLLFPWTGPFTNLAVRTHPTNFDQLILSASDDNTNFANKRISLAGLITNLPPAGALTNAADTNGVPYTTNVTLFAYQQYYTTNGPTNGFVVKFELSNLLNLFTNYFLTTSQRTFSFKSAELLVTNTLITIDIPHGLPGTPDSFRAVLLCKTNEAGYKAGDELVVDTGLKDTSDGKFSSYGRNTTNLFLVFKVDGRIAIPDKTTGAQTILTGGNNAWVPNWRLKFYANYFSSP